MNHWIDRDSKQVPPSNALLLFYGKNEKNETVYGWGTSAQIAHTLEQNAWISHWKIWEAAPFDEEIVQVE